MPEKGSAKIHLALVHFPVYNKTGEVVASSVTTLDVHDISRICRTFAVENFYVSTPLQTQKELVARIIGHWVEGYGAEYNPTRKEALLSCKVIDTVDEAAKDIEARYGVAPKLVVTDAKVFPRSVGYKEMRRKFEDGGHFLLLFGTGWGLEKNLANSADYVLNPIDGLDGFNHLPVRAAIAIILDRLLSKTELQ